MVGRTGRGVVRVGIESHVGFKQARHDYADSITFRFVNAKGMFVNVL
jgi:hypothetical protein